MNWQNERRNERARVSIKGAAALLLLSSLCACDPIDEIIVYGSSCEGYCLSPEDYYWLYGGGGLEGEWGYGEGGGGGV